MKKTLIIITNFLIVIFTLFFVSLYVKNQSSFMQGYNTENFMNMSIGMEQVTTNYLEGEQRLCDSWAACINRKNMYLCRAEKNIAATAHLTTPLYSPRS